MAERRVKTDILGNHQEKGSGGWVQANVYLKIDPSFWQCIVNELSHTKSPLSHSIYYIILLLYKSRGYSCCFRFPVDLVCLSYKASKWAGLSDETKKKRGPVSQWVWHDKNPSLLQSFELVDSLAQTIAALFSYNFERKKMLI